MKKNSFFEKSNYITKKIDNILLNHPFINLIELDYLKKTLTSYIQYGGKRIRPILFLSIYSLFSKKNIEEIPKNILKFAAAIELFHTWTLVHDDIIDKDKQRRGGETAHYYINKWHQKNFQQSTISQSKEFGNSIAILVGDLQQAWFFTLFNESLKKNKKNSLILKKITEELYPKLLIGESLDIELEYHCYNNISYDKFIQMISYKSAELLSFCSESALILSGEKKQKKYTQILRDFSLALGISFQLNDDILTFFGDKEKLGKDFANDLIQGKKNYFLKTAFNLLNTKEKEFLKSSKQNPSKKISEENLKKIQEIFNSSGVKQAVQEKGAYYAKKAQNCLKLLPKNNETAFLKQLTQFCFLRSY